MSKPRKIFRRKIPEMMMNPDLETTRSGVVGLAAEAFEKRERVKMLEMVNLPMASYEERKRAMIDLELARHEANQAEAALRALNPYNRS